jgi:hypothetical protein
MTAFHPYRHLLQLLSPLLLTVAGIAGAAAPTDDAPLRNALGLTDFAAGDGKSAAAVLYQPAVWYSSYFGGSNGYTYVTDIKVNAAGEIFLVGNTAATDLPATPGSAGANYFGGASDGFIAKFAADMRTLIWLKYIGTGSTDRVTAVALDSSGNAFASGYTFTPPFEVSDAFVGKFVYSGSDATSSYATFGGANEIDRGDDRALDLTVGPSGNIIVVGSTSSPNFPNTPGSLGGPQDGFVRRYNNNLGFLSSIFVDHEGRSDTLEAIDIGPDGKLWVAGSTLFLDVYHVLVAQLNSVGGNVPVNQMFYGNGDETAYDIRVAPGGDVWVVGATSSPDFHFGPVPDNTFAGPQDGFLAHLQPNGGLDYCTFLGGPGRQRARSVDIAANGDVIVAGVTQPFDNLESIEAFVLRANAPAFTSFDYSKTFGTPDFADVVDPLLLTGDHISLVRAPNNAIYIAGITTAPGFPTTTNPYQAVSPYGTYGITGFYMQWTNDDDFTGRFRFTAATASVNEGAGSVTLTVERILSTIHTESVSFATANGTATAPGDYTAVSGPLQFNPGEATKTITVPIVNDGTDENPETFTVTLSNPTNGATLGGLFSVTVTIEDNDNPPTLSLSNCSVTEGNTGSTNCRFVATLSARSGKAVTFATSAANGITNGAVAPGDYTAHTNVTRTIPVNTLSIDIDVPVIGDTQDEADENFRLTAGNLVDATAGTLSATGTILDDDAPAATNNAVFVSQVVPTLMETGKTYPIRITMRNTGTTTWTTAASYRLGSQNPDNNTTWDADGRIALPAGVAPNTTVEFVFNVVAPTPGQRNFQWRMVQDGVPQWFGQTTTNVAVVVINDRIYAGGFQQP